MCAGRKMNESQSQRDRQMFVSEREAGGTLRLQGGEVEGVW